MSMIEWAEKEVEIAKKRERGDNPEEAWEYGCSCYDSALKAFKCLCEDGHSGMSIQLTRNVLNRLISGRPLTPIEDTDDIWNERHYENDEEYVKYQCSRMSSLFKEVYRDGHVEYHDIDRARLVDVETDTTWYNGGVSNYIHKRFPITMPYLPDNKPYRVYSEDFLYKQPDAVGEYDHVAWLYLIKPDMSRETLNKFFAENEEGEMAEITEEQYYKDKAETFGESKS